MKLLSKLSIVLPLIMLVQGSSAWVAPSNRIAAVGPLHMGLKIGKNYKPKWKKKKSLGEIDDGLDLADKGLTGTIPVVFTSGEASISTMANPGDPIQAVASNAGQYIQYGCGKGDCGTCRSKCNGEWIKPCVAVVPELAEGQELVIEVKAVKHKGRSSGKFYSVRSFFMGFYNNVLGMYAFVTTRRAARKNYDERIEYEDMIAKRTAEKKAAKARQNSDMLP